MSLLTSLANKVRTPTYQVYVGGQPTKIVSASWDLGYDVISSSAVVVVNEIPTTLAFRQELEIYAGWDGFTAPAYKGEIEQDQRGWFPFDGTIRASGYLRRAQSKHPNALSYSNQNDEEIINSLLPLAGITNFSMNGEGVTDLGTVQPVALSAGTPIINLINEIDQIFSYKTFDASDGQVYRRRHAGLPSSTAAFTFTEGVNAYRITRRLGSVYDLNNQVNVYGLPQDTITWPTTRQGANPLVPDPPGFIAFDLRSSLIETQIVASVLAQRLMGEVNGIPDEVEIETWGNPLIQPSMTIEVTSPKDDLSAVHYWVKHIHHEITSNGYFMRVIGERRDGDLGEETGKPPVAQFVYRISKETYEVAGTPTTMFTVTADGSSSWDPDSPPSTLTFAWSNNKNADTGTEAIYSSSFTEAQMRAATAPTITLTVNDGDATSAAGSITKTITIGTDPINVRSLYVAVSVRAEATNDGGETWQTWTPGAGTVISTAPIAASTFGLFGLSNGKLMYTADFLLTAPTEAHDFGSQIDCIWVNELDANRVTVGLANGQVYVTNNMSAIGSSTWTQLADFASAVLWIEESAAAAGQYRLAMGNQVLLSHDSLATTGELVNFGSDTARAGATSGFANYYAASSADEIKREDGTAITGDATSDIRAIAHHIRDDVLFAVNTAGQSYRKAAGATALTAKVAISSPGTVNHMINDGDNQRIFYAAANDGLYKTFDEFTSAVRMRDYTAANVHGLKVGRASLALVNSILDGRRMIVLIRHTDGSPRIGYTDNVFASTVTWVGASTTGLPATIDNDKYSCFLLDPFDTTIAYVVTNRNAVYKNTAWRTAGSTWSLVFDLSTFNTLLGLSKTSIIVANQQGEIALTIASEGYIGMYVTNLPDVGAVYYIHSHDRGATWTAVATGLSGVPGEAPAAMVSQKNVDIVWVRSQTGGGSVSSFKSTTHGHSFSVTTSDTINFLEKMVFPVQNNVDSLVLYGMAPDEIGRSLDGTGGILDIAGFGATPLKALEIASDNRLNLFALQFTGGVTTLWRSTDGGVTDASAVGPAANLSRMATLRSNRHYYLGDAAGLVYTSEDHITLTARTGNFTSAVGTPSAVGGTHTVTVDFTS